MTADTTITLNLDPQIVQNLRLRWALTTIRRAMTLARSTMYRATDDYRRAANSMWCGEQDAAAAAHEEREAAYNEAREMVESLAQAINNAGFRPYGADYHGTTGRVMQVYEDAAVIVDVARNMDSPTINEAVWSATADILKEIDEASTRLGF